ncbi:hypothetical protein HYH03_003078 [Edaphochlamys debaryana]|nr:hypothetical protein HYH03_003078 [Edaphochlamys debaryana]|eukprot:KAG2498886.1 hypothetical protein HYH03_003078 [Edaphochlamys debaryana]
MLCVPQVDNPKLLRFLMVEPLLVGVMRKWNNNAGIVYAPDPQLHLQAFSHWTYEVTDKKLMVVDVQGFKMPAEGSAAPRILLVDPAIHCVGTDYFTSTNCGGEGGAGFDLFLESHRNPKTHYCGKACKAVRDKFKAFRKKQHEEAEQAERTRRAFSCLRVVPDRASPGGTASTSPLVDKKLGQLKPALKAHEECSKLLAGRALPVPGALFQAIEDCLKHRLMAPERVAELHRRRVEGNIGRHDWFDSMGNLTRVN